MSSALIHDGILEDPTRPGRVRANGRMNVCWQASANLLKVFDNSGTRPIEVRTILEDDIDGGVAEHRLRAHGLDVRRRQETRHDGVGDLVFDDVRWLPIPTRMHDDLHIRDIGERVEWNMAKRPDACESKQQDSSENQKAIAGTHIYEPR